MVGIGALDSARLYDLERRDWTEDLVRFNPEAIDYMRFSLMRSKNDISYFVF